VFGDQPKHQRADHIPNQCSNPTRFIPSEPAVHHIIYDCEENVRANWWRFKFLGQISVVLRCNSVCLSKIVQNETGRVKSVFHIPVTGPWRRHGIFGNRSIGNSQEYSRLFFCQFNLQQIWYMFTIVYVIYGHFRLRDVFHVWTLDLLWPRLRATPLNCLTFHENQSILILVSVSSVYRGVSGVFCSHLFTNIWSVPWPIVARNLQIKSLSKAQVALSQWMN